MPIAILWPLLQRFWPYIAGAGALLAIVIGFHFYGVHERQVGRAQQYAEDKIALDKLAADVRSATAVAQAADQKHADDVNAARTQGTKEANDALQPKLADARSRLAAYVRLHAAPSGTAQGGGDTADMPGTPASAAQPDSAGQYAVVPVDDLERCTEAITRLQNVQDWWSGVEKGPQ